MGVMDRSKFERQLAKRNQAKKPNLGEKMPRRGVLLTGAGVLGVGVAAIAGNEVLEHYNRKISDEWEKIKREQMEKLKDAKLREVIRQKNQNLENLENKIKKFEGDSRRRGRELDASMVGIPDHPEPELIHAYEQLFRKYSVERIMHKNAFIETQKEFDELTKSITELSIGQDRSDPENPVFKWIKDEYDAKRKRIEEQMKSSERQYQETDKKFADFLHKSEGAGKNDTEKPEDGVNPTRLV